MAVTQVSLIIRLSSIAETTLPSFSIRIALVSFRACARATQRRVGLPLAVPVDSGEQRRRWATAVDVVCVCVYVCVCVCVCVAGGRGGGTPTGSDSFDRFGTLHLLPSTGAVRVIRHQPVDWEAGEAGEEIDNEEAL